MPAPEGYVPGLGRGATGFTTRSDIGPARSGIPDESSQSVATQDDDNEEQRERFRDPENDTGLFTSMTAFDPEDEEADLIYSKIDQRMEERRKPQKGHDNASDDAAQSSAKISGTFSDLKRALGAITEDEWSNIPEVGDMTRRYKRQRKLQQQQQRFYSVPDSVLLGKQGQSALETSVAADESSQNNGTMTDLRTISSTRDKMLGMKLDQLRNTSSAQEHPSAVINEDKTIDTKGYLTSLAGSNIPTTAEIGDVRRLRPLLKSLVTADPNEPRGWIGLARLEELANRTQKALTIIEEGCQNNPKNEDVWMESIRLNENANIENAKKVVSRAVKHLPKSINLWIKASQLERDPIYQKKIVRMALENNPKSDTLWKTAVNLENQASDARLLLSQAVELVPFSEDLWLALARLETPENARKVLNRARKALKVSRAVWIAAARLEEQENGTFEKVLKRIERGVHELESEGALPDRSVWISDAEACEKGDAIITSRAIIFATIGLGLEGDDRKITWMEDGRGCEGRGSYGTARSIYEHALTHFPNSNSLWLSLCQLEKAHGPTESLFDVLEKAVTRNPNNEVFWLMYSKEKRISGDMKGAQDILKRAFEQNPTNENIWLSAVNIEAGNKMFDKARLLLQQARAEANTPRVWFKSVTFERQLKNTEAAFKLVTDGLEKYPTNDKLWMQKGQIYESQGEARSAVDTYRMGVKTVPHSITLWLLLSRQEEKIGAVTKARSTLEKASLKNPKNELIWLERVKLERRAGNQPQAKMLISLALKEIPSSGLLWSENIWLEAPIQRRSIIRKAIELCENDPYLLIVVAREFWRMGKTSKAKTWFQRSIQVNPDNGDAWIWYYKFLKSLPENSSPDDLKKCVNDFKVAEPRHGQVWPIYTKNPENFGKSDIELLDLASVTVTSLGD